MTDKQIIINGVDVSGCINYTDELKDCSCRLTYAPFNYRFCEQNPNCYYKQLAQKEQELKNICKAFDIEYIIDKETGNLICRCNKLYKKEQECEELKNTITNLENIRDEFSAKFDQLKKTLTEIKEICNSVKNIENINSLYDAKLSGMYLQARKILQKIREC